MALGLGSDSARVNEVAKLCRAVVPVMEGGCAPKAGLLVLAKSWCRMVGWTFESAEDKSCGLVCSTNRSVARSIVQESPFITVCDGLDQAFKGIWWMPWH